MRLPLFLLLLNSIFVPRPVLAMHLSPMERELVVASHGGKSGGASGGASASASDRPGEVRLLLQNDEAEARAVKLEIFKRSEDENGVERRTITSELAIETPVSVVAAGELREIILRYVGRQDIIAEQAYRLLVSETTGALRMKIVSSIYVRPETAKPNLIAEEAVQRKPAGRIRISLLNKGTAHQRLQEFAPVLLFGEKREPAQLTAASLTAWEKENVLAGMRRYLTLEVETLLPAKAKLQFALSRKH